MVEVARRDHPEVEFREGDLLHLPVREAGLAVEARLERASYPHEADTRRLYLLARRIS